VAPLGDKPWLVAPGPAFPTHALYIVPAQVLTQDVNTGLPTNTQPAPVPVLNPNGTPPRVRIGSKLMPFGMGGAMEQVGDAWISNLDRQGGYTLPQLLGAQFHLDTASGDLYEVMGSTVREAGPATWELALKRLPPRT
jgi:hypothetical protein